MKEVLTGSVASRYKMISLCFIISLDDRYIGFKVRPGEDGKLGEVFCTGTCQGKATLEALEMALNPLQKHEAT